MKHMSCYRIFVHFIHFTAGGMGICPIRFIPLHFDRAQARSSHLTSIPTGWCATLSTLGQWLATQAAVHYRWTGIRKQQGVAGEPY